MDRNHGESVTHREPLRLMSEASAFQFRSGLIYKER
ncbi:hypothetical protein C8D03_2298 [Bosea sp. 124]|nr:hypothetical protein C8D03_2298 [Bosea sp. 124]